MPKEVRYSDEFGELIRMAIKGMTFEQAGRQAGISSESVRRMAHNKVLERQTVDRFLAGFPHVDAHKVRVAAGYEQPADPIDACIVKLRGILTPADLEAVRADLNARVARRMAAEKPETKSEERQD